MEMGDLKRIDANDAEQERERDTTRCGDHGVPWRHRAQTDNNAEHNERWPQWWRVAQ